MHAKLRGVHRVVHASGTARYTEVRRCPAREVSSIGAGRIGLGPIREHLSRVRN